MTIAIGGLSPQPSGNDPVPDDELRKVWISGWGQPSYDRRMAAEMARELLARRAAEREEQTPITEDWYWSVIGENMEHPFSPYSHFGGGWSLRVTIGSFQEWSVHHTLHTRRDVRDLARLCGIQLKEESK